MPIHADLQIGMFFQTLFFFAANYVELRTIPGDGKYIRLWLTLSETIQRVPRLLADGYDLRFGVLPRLKGGGKFADIAAFNAVYADIDESPDICGVRLASFPVKPTMIVESGRGLHCYWVFAEPLSSKDKSLWSRMQHRVVNKLGADKSGTDPVRMLRIPGSFNQKRQKTVNLLSVDSKALYYPTHFAEQIGVVIDATPKLPSFSASGQSRAAATVTLTAPAQPKFADNLQLIVNLMRPVCHNRYLPQKNILLLERCPACLQTLGSSEPWKAWLDAWGNLRCWRASCYAGPAKNPGGLTPAEWMPGAANLGLLESVG